MAGFTDRYQAALLDLIKAKVAGTPPVLVPRNGNDGSAISLIEALRQSVAQVQPKPQLSVRRNGHRKMALAA
jgi:non-homologous end joining protein Ku